MRELLRGNVTWQLGRGDKCRAFGDPWHHFWQQFLLENNQQRNMMVQELINLNTNSWFTQNLISCFGFHGALFIATQFPEPAANAGRSDRLIFLPASNGKFSFKGAVKLLSGMISQISQHDRHILKTIWHHQGLTPRVRFFMWRLFQNSIPTSGTYALKMHQAMVTCQLCDSGHDYGVHALFKCNSARAFWLASPLGLHTDSLPDEPKQLLHVIISALQGNNLSSFANHMWALWKHRCLVIHENKKFNVESGLSIARGYDALSLCAGKFQPHIGVQKIYGHGPPQDADIGFKCWLDGSYDERGDGGWACVLKKDGFLVYSETGFGFVSSPFHAELNALQLAMIVITREEVQECTFLTDCQVLYKLLSGEEIFDAIPWQCYFQAKNLVQTFIACQYCCVFVSRDYNMEAHRLANQARICKGVS
ncbi:Ribonuclease H-like superfamily protein [Rhynchospora pubera]|uniref:Ribonuclease H-like superfamily protein n=1 Tax=Rhynchospora pubera TaxID=906938 RepID=A0AAV8FN88_9POAL|nr:Ribonuclease H-like superfamily protein [Rhynchospora pubera]